jgi:hypothetical protein
MPARSRATGSNHPASATVQKSSSKDAGRRENECAAPGRRTVAALAAAARYAQAGGAAPGTGCGPAGTSLLVDEPTDICYNKISKNNGGGRHERGKPARETTRIC